MSDSNEYAAYFHSLTDEELISQSSNGLTDVARKVAEAEIVSRGLKLPDDIDSVDPDCEGIALSGSYVDVARLQDDAEANILKNYLENQGIPAVVDGENVARTFGGAFGGVILRVDQAFEKQALELLAKYDAGEFQLSESSVEAEDGQPLSVQENPQWDKKRTYRVYSHPEKTNTVVVKVGFSWVALIFGPLWYLLNKMWLNFLIYALLVVGGSAYFSRFVPTSQGEAALLFGMNLLYLVAWFLFSWFANRLLCLDL